MPPDTLTWRDGAYLDDKDRPPCAPLPPDVDLDDLGAGPVPVHSIPYLTAEKRTDDAATARFNRAVAAMPDQETQTLIMRIETQPDALILWELHQELDRRGIPPAQRWPANRDTLQAEFITLLADLFWLATRHTDQAKKPVFKNWLALFKLPPDSEAWQAKAYFFFRNLSRTNRARHGTKALALTKAQRQELMLFPTALMRGQRQRYLDRGRVREMHQALYSEAMANPYRARASNPKEDADDRETLWRVFILSASSPTETTRVYPLVTDTDGVTRQGISKRLATIKRVLKKYRL